MIDSCRSALRDSCMWHGKPNCKYSGGCRRENCRAHRSDKNTPCIFWDSKGKRHKAAWLAARCHRRFHNKLAGKARTGLLWLRIRSLVNTIMTLMAAETAGNFLTSCGTISFSGRIPLHSQAVAMATSNAHSRNAAGFTKLSYV